MELVKETKDEWKETGNLLAFFWGSELDKELSIKVRYDGYGNSVVRYIVKHNGKETSYEKYDSAVGAYNMIHEKTA